jgi:hypothetical protein
MPDLIFFLEQHACRIRTEEIEAILRRCDHDSDGALSYEEFMALVEDPQIEGEVDQDKRVAHYDQELKEYHER